MQSLRGWEWAKIRETPERVRVEKLGMGQDEGNEDNANGCKKIDFVCQRPGASGRPNWASWALDPVRGGQCDIWRTLREWEWAKIEGMSGMKKRR